MQHLLFDIYRCHRVCVHSDEVGSANIVYINDDGAFYFIFLFFCFFFSSLKQWSRKQYNFPIIYIYCLNILYWCFCFRNMCRDIIKPIFSFFYYYLFHLIDFNFYIWVMVVWMKLHTQLYASSLTRVAHQRISHSMVVRVVSLCSLWSSTNNWWQTRKLKELLTTPTSVFGLNDNFSSHTNIWN
jgi:hypothetical protein